MAERVSEVARLFDELRPYLRRDLTVSCGIPNPVAGQILNWFDPANEEYLSRVDAWQKCLCTGITASPIPFMVEHDDFGRYRDDLSVIEVKAIQQVAKLLYKFHGTPAKKTDWSEVETRLSNPLPMRLTDVEVAGIRAHLSGVRPIDLNDCIGRFGPGATSEGFRSIDKWMRRGMCPDVPANLYRCSLRDPWCPVGLNPFRVTKMAEVPKSIKSNRVVSSEPAMSMFAQLAVGDALADQIHWIFPSHVSLHDQEKHNRLLRTRNQQVPMATLDLSDASDHVQCDLVESVLPQLWPVLAKVRSEYSVSPNSCFKLSTFAPMGSGVCFPVMTTVILGIIAYAFTSWNIRWETERWSVYGDDIIVPLYIAQYVIDLLERAGLVVNVQKSCTDVRYLESCGLEVYRDCDVTPAYIKDPISVLGAEKVEQIADKLGELFPNTAMEVMRRAQAIRGLRYNATLQRQEILIRTSAARSKLALLDEYEGLNRWFCTRSLQNGFWRQGSWRARPSGVEYDVWTKPAWRYKPSDNYPNLTLWLVSNSTRTGSSSPCSSH